MQSDGVVHDIHYGDVLIKFGSILDMEDEEVPYIAIGKEGKASAQLQDGDIVIADTAEDETAGKVVEIYNAQRKRIEAGLHTIPCRPISAYAPMYLGYYMNSMFYHSQLLSLLQGVKVLSISKANISKTVITSPQSKTEQEKISSFLYLIDLKVKKQRQVIDTLKKYKRGVMQKVFRNMSAFSPSGFETVRLSDIFKKVSRRNSNGEIKNVITNSAEHGLIPQRDFFDKDIAVDGNTGNYYVIEYGDFVYNPRKSNTAPYGPFNRYERQEKGIISPLYTCLVLKADIEPAYLAWYFKSDAWYRYIYDNGSQGVRHDRVSMTDDLLMGMPVIIPSKDSQIKIAKLLDCLEKRFQVELSQCEYLKTVREALLQQLFI